MTTKELQRLLTLLEKFRRDHPGHEQDVRPAVQVVAQVERSRP